MQACNRIHDVYTGFKSRMLRKCVWSLIKKTHEQTSEVQSNIKNDSKVSEDEYELGGDLQGIST